MSTDLLPLNPENAPVGTQLKTYTVTFDREAAATALARTGETPEQYELDGALRVPPLLLLGCYGRLIHESFHYETGVHVSSELTLHALPRLNEPLTVSGAIEEYSERGGSKYVRFSVNVAGADGTPAATVQHVSIYALQARAGRG